MEVTGRDEEIMLKSTERMKKFLEVGTISFFLSLRSYNLAPLEYRTLVDSLNTISPLNLFIGFSV